MFDLRFRYPIGIDIGDQYIYAAQLKPDQEGIAVRGLWRREFDGFSDGFPDDEDALVSVLKGIVKSKHFQGKSAVIHLPNQVIISMPIRFQRAENESVEEGIFKETEKHLSFPIGEAILDYPSIAEKASGNQTEYSATVVAARKDHIQQYIAILKRAGLVVEAVDYGVSSLVRLHDLTEKACVNTNILCYIGYKQSLLTVVVEDHILAQRPFTWGFKTLLDKVLANLELPADKATFLLNKYGLGYEDLRRGSQSADGGTDDAILNLHRALFQIITPYIDELIYEFHTITSYVRSESQHSEFERIFMYGCANMMHFLDTYLEKRVSIPVSILNPLSELKMAVSYDAPFSDVTEGAPFGLALGLATRKVSWL